MDDDIVTRLNEQAKAPALVWLAEAADEIERLRAALTNAVKSITNRERENDELHDDLTRLLEEVGRLRAAGDALHAAVRNHDLTEAHMKAWEEARRG